MSPRHLLTLIRPEHWVKNLFLFIPAFFAARLSDPFVLRNAVLGFIAFCLIASAVYFSFPDPNCAENTKQGVSLLQS